MTGGLEDRLAPYRAKVDEALDRLLPIQDGPAATVAGAMRYAVLGGGKRLRPVLALLACEACGGAAPLALEPAAAVELIHAYSLVHDDLPSMDDDDLRRGRPTVHRAFDEATAVLAGDGLLTLAFEVLATYPRGREHAPGRADAVAVAARAAGVAGMVGGQIADIEAEGAGADGTASRLEWIHRHKTGALIACAAEIGAIHAGADGPRRRAVAEYGALLGLGFQIADDILDETASAETLGKTPGKDRRSDKTTYPGVYGLETARRHARTVIDSALAVLRSAELDDPLLAELARHAIERSS